MTQQQALGARTVAKPAAQAAAQMSTHPAAPAGAGAGWRNFGIGLMAFLTLVDLFATQAILPSLAAHYRVAPAAMGLAVNASTIGMAIAALAAGLFGSRLDRRRGVVVSLALLTVPTALLAFAPDLATFTALRITQGLAMATAFALTLSYLAEHCSAGDAAGAFAAYVGGNVASNLFGRLFSAALADHLGLAANFQVFAALNLAGAVLAYVSLHPAMALATAKPLPSSASPSHANSPAHLALPETHRAPSALQQLRRHLREPALRASFAIGFLILFAFIGTFTYVNFVLARPPLALAPMSLGLVYFVFAPALLTTPLAGRVVQRFGTRHSFVGALVLALAGLPLLLLPQLAVVVVGLALVGVGTFMAQATATGFVGR